MKPCITCKKTLPLSDFYAHPQMADGHLSKCKECHKTYVQNRYREVGGRPEYERERNQRPERKAARRVYQQACRKRSPGKNAAYKAVQRAVAGGRLQRQPCGICGDPKSQAHHTDYAKPLDVEWLCFRHHREIGHGQTVRSRS